MKWCDEAKGAGAPCAKPLMHGVVSLALVMFTYLHDTDAATIRVGGTSTACTKNVLSKFCCCSSGCRSCWRCKHRQDIYDAPVSLLAAICLKIALNAKWSSKPSHELPICSQLGHLESTRTRKVASTSHHCTPMGPIHRPALRQARQSSA